MYDNLAEPDRFDYAPLVMTQEQAEFILQYYELHPVTGRRVIRRGVISRPRGWGKSPFLSSIALAEALGPVVFDGWDAYGQPVGKPWARVRRPVIAVAAATEDQTRNAWDPLLDMLSAAAPIHDNYPGLEPMDTQINLPYGHIQPVFSSPNSTKGLQTVFVIMDQTEQWTSKVSKQISTILRANTVKRGGSYIEAPNAFIPGQDSVAEQSAQAYFAQLEGRTKNEKGLLYDHREAPATTNILERESLLLGLRYAYGDSMDHPDGCVIHEPPCQTGWVDPDIIMASIWDEDADENESRADYLNIITEASDAWVGQSDWQARSATFLNEQAADNADLIPPLTPGDTITLGFDGSRGRVKGKPDATALIGCRVSDGYVFRLGVWEATEDKTTWQTWEPPIPEIEALIDETFRDYNVVAFYADPGKDWRSHINTWEAKYGTKVPVKASRNHPFEWWMGGGQARRAETAIEETESAVLNGDMTHDGSYDLTRHVLQTKRRISNRHLALSKDAQSSPRKIDAAVAMVLAWAARREAVAAGHGQEYIPSIPLRLR